VIELKMKLEKAIIELYKRTATIIPADVETSLKNSLKKEKSLAHNTISNILKNIELAKNNSLPICQDTGTPAFYLKVPIGISHQILKQAIINATRKATKNIPLRPNAVNTLDEKNTGDNIGFNKDKTELQQPIIHIGQWNKKYIHIDLMLKGGGSENIGMQYKLPNKALKADRNIEGVKKCIIDAVFKAQGKGCPPYIVGVAIGGSKDLISKQSKKQLLRKINDTNEDKNLAKIEKGLLNKINSLGIGPLGLGGKTTILGVKIKALHRHPASFFVDISFMCWACRRGTLTYKKGDAEFS
jgi:fumarate hydratase class I